MGFDSAFLQIFVHVFREPWVIIARQRGRRHIKQPNFFSSSLCSLRNLNTYISGSYHSHILYRRVADLSVYFLTILKQLQKADSLQITTWNLRSNRQRTCRQNQLVIALLKSSSIQTLTENLLSLKIDFFHRSLHADICSLCLESLSVSIEKILIGINLSAHPKCSTTTEITQITISINHYYLLLRIIVQQCVRGSNARMICSDNHCFHNITSVCFLYYSSRYNCFSVSLSMILGYVFSMFVLANLIIRDSF